MKGFDPTRLSPSDEDRLVEDGERAFAPLIRQRMELFALRALQKSARMDDSPPQCQPAAGADAPPDSLDELEDHTAAAGGASATARPQAEGRGTDAPDGAEDH